MNLSSKALLLTLILFPALATFASTQSPPRSLEYELSIKRWNDRFRFSYKIIGGHDADYANYKWEVALVNATIPDNLYAQFCGASYIAKYWLVTAAHCIAGLSPSDIKIMYGSSRLDASGTRETVDTIVPCKNCARGHATDIALIKIHNPLSITPVPLAPKDKARANLKPGAVVTISGWGLLDPVHNPSRSVALQEANVKFQALSDCNGPEGYNGAISSDFFCAGLTDGTMDSCTGDSGGPALIQIDGSPALAGIVSKGNGCGRPKKYGVYTQLSELDSWVVNQTK